MDYFFKEITEFANSETLKAVSEYPLSAALVSAAGAYGASRVLPRAGPLRAIVFAVKSKLLSAPRFPSIRTNEIAGLRRMINEEAGRAGDSQGYAVIVGDKGVGKTHMLRTAFAGRCGVLHVNVDHSLALDAIVTRVLCNVANVSSWLGLIPDPEPDAKRVLFFYKLFRFPAPVVIMHIAERGNGFLPSDAITGAVREVREKYGLIVVVDAPPNSAPESPLTTHRQFVITIEPLTREQVISLPQFSTLVKELEEAKLLDAAWMVLGGNPAEWDSLRRARDGKYREQWLCDQVGYAADSLHDYRQTDKRMVSILDQIRATDQLRLRNADVEVVLPSPDKVLSRKRIDKAVYVVPATPAMALALRYGLDMSPTPEELRDIVRRELEREQEKAAGAARPEA